VQFPFPIFNDPLSKISKTYSQSSLISLAILLLSVMLVSHSLSMMSPLICFVDDSFIVLDTSSPVEYIISFWRVILTTLYYFSLKIILSKALFTP
jgi:hypothetical protein